MECFTTEGLSGDMDSVGEAVRDNPHLCCSCGRAATRRMDPPSARHSTGLSIGPTPIYSRCGRFGCVHIAVVSQWHLCWVSVF